MIFKRGVSSLSVKHVNISNTYYFLLARIFKNHKTSFFLRTILSSFKDNLVNVFLNIQSEGQESNFIASDKKCVKPRFQIQQLLSLLSRKLLVSANISLRRCTISIRASIMAQNVLREIRFAAQLNIISSNDFKCLEHENAEEIVKEEKSSQKTLFLINQSGLCSLVYFQED